MVQHRYDLAILRMMAAVNTYCQGIRRSFQSLINKRADWYNPVILLASSSSSSKWDQSGCLSLSYSQAWAKFVGGLLEVEKEMIDLQRSDISAMISH